MCVCVVVEGCIYILYIYVCVCVLGTGVNERNRLIECVHSCSVGLTHFGEW